MSVDGLFDIRGKVALVTGGTSGIGRMIARGFVARGVKTYITSRDRGRADADAAELSELGECHGLSADLAREDGPEALAKAFGERERTLDILVNNAGANARGRIEDMSAADWDMVMDVNLRAVFFLIQQLLPNLRAAASADSPARIINIGSIGGAHIPNWEAYPYGASKAAVHHLTRALAKRFGPEHSPGSASCWSSPMFVAFGFSFASVDEDRSAWIKPALILLPLLAPARDLRPQLLDGEQSFF